MGSLQGHISNGANGNPVAGATVTVVGPATRTATTNSGGDFTVALPIGSYDATVSAFGFASETRSGVDVSEGAVTRLDVALNAAPSYRVSGYVRDDSGSAIANATVRILATPIAPALSDASGYYSFASVPQGTYDFVAQAGQCNLPQTQNAGVSGDQVLDFSLPVRRDNFGYACQLQPFNFIEANTVIDLSGDDSATAVALPFSFGFYGQTYDTAYVSTNGSLNFLQSDTRFSNEPIPNPAAPNAAIYPFWDDLVVDGAASVRTELVGSAPNRRFVIEWRNLAFCCISNERVRFEVVLHEDGKILTQYTSIDNNERERGSLATVGIENETGTTALQYSYDQPTLTDGLAVLYSAPAFGFVEGRVSDVISGTALVGATVRAVQNGSTVRETTTAADGRYRLLLPIGAYAIKASATNYLTRSSNVTVGEGQTVTRNFALKSARASVAPSSLNFMAVPGRTLSQTLTLRNAGRANLNYTVVELPVASAANAKATLQQGITAKAAPAGYKPTTVTATFTGAQVLLLMDVLPFGSDALQQVLAANGIAFDIATSREMGSIDLSRYSTVIIASDQTLGFYVNYGVNRSKFRDYVGAGGFLWVGAAAWGWNGGNFDGEQLPGGTVVRGPVYEYTNEVVDETHPAMQGVPNPFTGSAASHAVFADLPQGAKTIARGHDTGLPTLVEYAYGSGRVLAFGQTLEFGFAYGEPSGRILENGIPYAYAFDPSEDIPWLSAAPVSGTLAPGARQSIRVTVDTRGVKPGLYRARLQVRSNDPTAARILVPITLVVPAYEKAVNAGGSGYTDRKQLRWLADRKYSAGGWGYVNSSSALSTTHAIAGTLDDPLFQKQREGALEYRFDKVPQGVYEIDLRFAEIKNQQPNRRLFHVLVEGNVKIFAHDTNLDAGNFAADDHTLFVKVTDGQLNLRFLPLPGSEQPIVNALRVTHRPDR
jgi:hypothetical protein